MDIHDVIVHLCYCHHEVLSTHLSEELDDKRANGAPASKRSSFNLSWCITRIWSITPRILRWTLGSHIWQGANSWRTQEPVAAVAKLEEQNLEIPEICQKLKDIRTMVHAKDVETQKFVVQLENIKGRHERILVNRDDLAKELDKDKHDQKKPWETWTRLEVFGDLKIYWPLEDQTPLYLR